MSWIIDDIAGVLASTDVKKIMNDFYQEGKGHDPIIHFYETFLAAYDPKEREKRGVYYTPESVVSYIVRSVHKVLKEKFGKNFHIHLYTSLNLVSKDALERLYSSGLDEIRFHLDLNSNKLWEKLDIAGNFEWDVGVELPLIPTKEKI